MDVSGFTLCPGHFTSGESAPARVKLETGWAQSYAICFEEKKNPLPIPKNRNTFSSKSLLGPLHKLLILLSTVPKQPTALPTYRCSSRGCCSCWCPLLSDGGNERLQATDRTANVPSYMQISEQQLG